MAKKNIDKIDNYNKLTEGRIIAIKPIVREDSMSDTTVCLNERKYMYEYCVKGKFLTGSSWVKPCLSHCKKDLKCDTNFPAGLREEWF